jgi:hypothetical protein
MLVLIVEGEKLAQAALGNILAAGEFAVFCRHPRRHPANSMTMSSTLR